MHTQSISQCQEGHERDTSPLLCLQRILIARSHLLLRDNKLQQISARLDEFLRLRVCQRVGVGVVDTQHDVTCRQTCRRHTPGRHLQRTRCRQWRRQDVLRGVGCFSSKSRTVRYNDYICTLIAHCSDGIIIAHYNIQVY